MPEPILSEGLVETEHLRLYVLHARPAEPQGQVLLLGGSNFDLRLKRQFLTTALARDFEVLTYEPRGIGRSDRPAGEWEMEAYAADALALLDALGWQEADVFGESFGGMTALHVARVAPERVGRLALASTTAGGAGGSSFDIGAFLALPREEAAAASLALQDRAIAQLGISDPSAYARKLQERIAFETAFADPSIVSGGYAKLLRARAAHDVWAALRGILHPTLVLIGARDGQAPPEAQHAMAARLPNAEALEFDAGHGVAFSEPDATEALSARWQRAKSQRSTTEERKHG
ncbi:MAG: alpha/beta hydrolase [Pseudomonadota bacterium]